MRSRVLLAGLGRYRFKSDLIRENPWSIIFSRWTLRAMRVPRVAYFPDSFHEVNGVAHTSRNFLGYAQRRGLPFL